MTVSVLWHSLRVPWVGLQCVFVVFPDQTHLLWGLKASLSAVHLALPDVKVCNVKVLSNLYDAMRMPCCGMCLSCRTPSCPVVN